MELRTRQDILGGWVMEEASTFVTVCDRFVGCTHIACSHRVKCAILSYSDKQSYTHTNITPCRHACPHAHAHKHTELQRRRWAVSRPGWTGSLLKSASSLNPTAWLKIVLLELQALTSRLCGQLAFPQTPIEEKQWTAQREKCDQKSLSVIGK